MTTTRSLLLLIVGSLAGTIYAQELTTLNPTNEFPIDIDQDLIDNFNSPDNIEKCLTIYDNWSAEGRSWNSATSEELKVLRYCDEIKANVWDIVGEGCSWYCGGNLGVQTASSYLPSQGSNTYSASNAHDLNFKTAWVEGVEGYGIGEYIEYELPPDNPRINQVIIANGYVKSEAAWLNNSRVKKLKMYINGEAYAFLNLSDSRSEQTFSVDNIGYSDRRNPGLESKPSWKIRFEIVEVYKGKKYDDVAIAEIYFDGIDVH